MLRKLITTSVIASAIFAQANAVPLFSEDFSKGLNGQFTAYSVSSDKNWGLDDYRGVITALMNGYGGTTGSDDWLISPAIDLTPAGITAAQFSFTSRVRFDGKNLSVKASTDYVAGTDPSKATWVELNAALPQDGQGSSGSSFESSGNIDLATYLGQSVYLAYHYQTTADAEGNNAAWHIDDVMVDVAGIETVPVQAGLVMSESVVMAGDEIDFSAYAYGGVAGDYTYSWDLGDGSNSTDIEFTHAYAAAGEYTVSLTVTDTGSNSKTVTKTIMVEAVKEPVKYQVKAKKSADSIRVASFNVSMEAENYTSDDIDTKGSQILVDELASGENQQIKNIAEIIQRVRPDVILLNEFDYIADTNSGVEMFISQYLNIAQNENAVSIDYPYYFVAPSNTGEPTSFDLNNDGEFTATQDDAYGFGRFPGHYAMVILSRYPIAQDKVRTFQKFLWKDMPNHLMPSDPQTGANWYNEAETAEFRLSSKSHWDVPVMVDGETIHVLASHPTPPTFDGDEDRNGRRNHDEIRFWADYVDTSTAAYIYDDNGAQGGLNQGARFVITGDLNASTEGDSYPGTIEQLLLNPLVSANYAPSSEGGSANAGYSDLSPFHTATWAMRADYVLPSKAGLNVEQGGVFWPTEETDAFYLVESRTASSDHRLVWLDLAITETQEITDEPDEQEADLVIESGSSGYWFALAGLVMAMLRRQIRRQK
ncbi:endonuclease/exonuclease/phosphatase family protein [Catenovulum sp. 2E275]|uniref:endonuclease/exonuclease/phosphatase family protein n=1 Tax=Catenovulum sp. 2E275 TaxID=2980497 RepID=UPI0021CEC67A|nr:endonuclease/exonuclease/phosphatase family protein [Catenovulum sp. 2E275]MCU4675278.1 endonuclease/exonuclease/phosphatase family protein [Catenovulum sp. 2E275]